MFLPLFLYGFQKGEAGGGEGTGTGVIIILEVSENLLYNQKRGTPSQGAGYLNLASALVLPSQEYKMCFLFWRKE